MVAAAEGQSRETRLSLAPFARCVVPSLCTNTDIITACCRVRGMLEYLVITHLFLSGPTAALKPNTDGSFICLHWEAANKTTADIQGVFTQSQQ